MRQFPIKASETGPGKRIRPESAGSEGAEDRLTNSELAGWGEGAGLGVPTQGDGLPQGLEEHFTVRAGAQVLSNLPADTGREFIVHVPRKLAEDLETACTRVPVLRSSSALFRGRACARSSSHCAHRSRDRLIVSCPGRRLLCHRHPPGAELLANEETRAVKPGFDGTFAQVHDRPHFFRR